MPEGTNGTGGEGEENKNLGAGASGNTPENEGGEGGGEQQATTWEEVLATLPEAQRTMYTEHTRGLRSALDSERGQRKDLSKQLRDATEQLEAGSAARDALEKLQTSLDEAERRADFAEDAVKQGVTNPRLAWMAAQQIEAFDRRGNADWDALKTAFPELFRKPIVASANAGAGTDTRPPAGASMNQLIRQAAGKGG